VQGVATISWDLELLRCMTDCRFTNNENMDPVRRCVRMILLTNDAEKVISMLEKNYGVVVSNIDRHKLVQ
jgi:hypothetical protein